MKKYINSIKIPLTPGNLGKDCLGNGENKYIECCCDECDYLMCCTDEAYPKGCVICADLKCPRKAPASASEI